MGLNTILLAVGPDDTDRADRLAEETIDSATEETTVVLAHVFSRSEYEDTLDNLSFDRTSGSYTADDVAERHATVRAIARRLDEADVDHAVRGGVGQHGQEIVDLAGEVGADRVFVGGRQRSPTGKAVFGSVAQEVMMSSPSPVTFVRADTV